MKVLLIFALIGLGYALQGPVQYEYEYFGRIATAHPRLRSQAAAGGIKCRVIVNMESKTTATVKLEQIQVGTKNEDVPQELRGEIQFSWQQLSSAPQLQEPFKVNFNQEEGSPVMEVPSSDLVWMTNLRKAIVQQLRASSRADLKGAMGDMTTNSVKSGVSAQSSKAFSMVESTLIGQCESQYTLTLLPQVEAEVEKHYISQHLKEDAQAGGSKEPSVPKLQTEKLWRLTRAINTRRCYDEVMMQHAGAGNETRIGHGQFQSIASRSSNAYYILRGEPNAFRMDSAVVEGTIVELAVGNWERAGEIQTITNQTFVLVKVQKQTPMKAASGLKPVTTWKQEIISPNSPPTSGEKWDWVHYMGSGSPIAPINPEMTLTGIKMTEQIIGQYTAVLYRIFDKVVEEIQAAPKSPSSEESPLGTSTGIATLRLRLMARIINALPKQNLQQIFNKVYGESGEKGYLKQELVVDTFASAGSGASIQVVMENIKSGKISSSRATTVFASLVMNSKAPAVIKDIMAVVKSLDLKSEPALASTAYINFARLCHQQCVRQYFRNYSIPLPVLGNQECSLSEIKGDFLPWLQSKLQSSSESWERTIIVTAIGNLGVPESIQALRPIIDAEKESNNKVRIAAIRALRRKNIQAHLRDEVFEILMARFANVGDSAEVRQACIKTLLEWHPNAAWWQDLAARTWREPSRQMTAFIATTIETVARMDNHHYLHQARLARSVLTLTKPIPAGFKHSTNWIASKYYPINGIGSTLNAGWFSSSHTRTPQDMYVEWLSQFENFRVSLVEGALSLQGFDKQLSEFMNSIQKGYRSTSSGSVRGAAQRRAHGDRESIMDSLKLTSEYAAADEPEAVMFLRLFDNMQYMMPMNKQIIARLASAGGETLVKKFMSGPQPIHATKYYDALPIHTFFATDLGVPVVASRIVSILHVAEGTGQVKLAGVSNPSMSDLLTVKEAEAITDINWRLAVKVSSSLNAYLPWVRKTVAAGVDMEKSINMPVKAEIKFTRPDQSQWATYGSWNVSFAVQPRTQEQFPVVFAQNMPYTQVREMFHIHDIDEMKDIKIVQMDKNRKPFIKEEREVGEKYFGVKGVGKWMGDAENPIGRGYFTRMIQEPVRVMTLLGSPVHRYWRTEYILNPASSEAKAFRLSFSNQHERFQMPTQCPKDNHDWSGTAYYASCQQMECSRPLRFYALSGRYVSGISGDKTKSSIQVNGLRGPIEGEQDEKMLCNVVEMESPKVNTFAALNQAIQSAVKADIKGKMMYGKSCVEQQQQVGEMSGILEVTDVRRQELQAELKETATASSAYPTAHFPISAVYDKFESKLTWNPTIPKDVLNATFIIGDLITGATFPFVEHNHMQSNQQHVLQIEGRRPLPIPRWNFWFRAPSQTIFVSRVYIPRVLDGVTPIGGVTTKGRFFPGMLLNAGSNRCQIESGQVTTFDGVRYQPEITPCWTVVATDRSNTDSFKVLARREGGSFRVKIATPQHSAEIVSESEVKVDGTSVPLTSSPATHGPFQVSKSSEGARVKYQGEVTVYMKSSVIAVEGGEKNRGRMAGLCGDFNGETKYDLTGPQRCIYNSDSNPKLYAWAWTIGGGQGCDQNKLSAEQQKVQQYQTSCPKAPSPGMANMAAIAGVNPECERMAFRIMEHNGELCLTQNQVRMCKQGCRGNQKSERQVRAKCFPMHQAPRDLTSNYPSPAYLTHQIPEAGRQETISAALPGSCTK